MLCAGHSDSGTHLNIRFGGFNGDLSSLGGCVLAFILMFMLHVFGAMGAGDVKLFAAIGSVIGAQLGAPHFCGSDLNRWLARPDFSSAFRRF